MATWSTRRKSIFAALFLIIAAVAIGIPSFLLFYKAPTCFDGAKNGDEQGTDCGGSCTKLCSSSFLPLPPAQWVRFKEVAPNSYNVAAYIVNPNPNATAARVPYRIDFLDKDGITIATAQGTVTVPPGRNTLAFNAGVSGGVQVPVRAILTYTGEPEWFVASDQLSMLDTSKKDYTEDSKGSALTVTFVNKSTLPVENLTVYAILRDKDTNVLDFSKTVIDRVPAHGSAMAPFTWPVSHDGAVISIEVLPVAE